MTGQDAISKASLVTAGSLKALGICLTVVGSLLVFGRYGILGYNRRLWQWEDSFALGAWLCFLAICILYMVVISPMYRILQFEADGFKPYPQLVSDGTMMTKIFFPATLLHWCCLWLVKFAFMAQIKRLIKRQRHYIVAWWSILAFTCLVFIGCVVSEFTSCRNMHDWFTFGQCSTDRDAKASQISLYYAFSVDVLTDLLIVVLPIRLLWGLQITRWKKIRILSLFFVVALGICAAIVRVIAVGTVSHSNQPSPSWLALWAMVEAFIAIIVACMPAYGMLCSPSASRSKRYQYHGDAANDSRSKRTRSGDDGPYDGSKGSNGSKHRTMIESGIRSDDLELLATEDKTVYMTTTIDAHSSKLSSRDGHSEDGKHSEQGSLS